MRICWKNMFSYPKTPPEFADKSLLQPEKSLTKSDFFGKNSFSKGHWLFFPSKSSELFWFKELISKNQHVFTLVDRTTHCLGETRERISARAPIPTKLSSQQTQWESCFSVVKAGHPTFGISKQIFSDMLESDKSEKWKIRKKLQNLNQEKRREKFKG